MRGTRALRRRYTAAVSFDPDVGDGSMKHHVPVPEDLAEAWMSAGVTRLAGTLDGTPFRRAMARRADGSPCIRFGAGWLQDAGLEVGRRVRVEVGPDEDPAGVDVPPILSRLLDLEPEVAASWEGLTPGRRRTLVYPVTRAKLPETQLRRAEAVIDALRRGELPGPPKRRRRR